MPEETIWAWESSTHILLQLLAINLHKYLFSNQ